MDWLGLMIKNMILKYNYNIIVMISTIIYVWVSLFICY